MQLANVMRAVLVSVGLLAGCAGLPDTDPGPAAGSPPARVAISAHLPPPLTIDGLAVHLDDGTRRWVVRGRDLEHASGNVWRGTPQATADHGTLRVRYVLETAGGTVVSGGSMALPLKPDWIHGVDIHAANEDPRRYCMGCLGSLRFPLAADARSEAASAVYMVWGGNSIQNPAVY